MATRDKPLDDPSTDGQVLARSELYTCDVVEAHNLCPYAKPARENGKVLTQLVRGVAPTTELLERMIALQQSGDDDFEVALLIAPDVVSTPPQWERLIRDMTEASERALGALGKRSSLYTVAFHPDLSYGTDSPERLVGLLRRSPDPTIQLVRRSLLDRIRGTRGEACYLDVADLDTPEAAMEALAAQHGGTSLSQRIAQANFATWQQLAGKLETALAQLQHHRRQAHDEQDL